MLLGHCHFKLSILVEEVPKDVPGRHGEPETRNSYTLQVIVVGRDRAVDRAYGCPHLKRPVGSDELYSVFMVVQSNLPLAALVAVANVVHYKGGKLSLQEDILNNSKGVISGGANSMDQCRAILVFPVVCGIRRPNPRQEPVQPSIEVL